MLDYPLCELCSPLQFKCSIHCSTAVDVYSPSLRFLRFLSCLGRPAAQIHAYSTEHRAKNTLIRS